MYLSAVDLDTKSSHAVEGIRWGIRGLAIAHLPVLLPQPKQKCPRCLDGHLLETTKQLVLL